jgi:dihydrofolate synthase / folylpolyglutamate synthase
VNYPDSVHYLYTLSNELKPGAKFGLERMQALLTELGSPHLGMRTVHVAGTNGKGSTCAMVASIAHEAGIRTGLNTSPHLIEPTERVQINGQPVTDAEFAAAFEVVHAASERLLTNEKIDDHPSYFETVTAMAFVLFRERKCDLNVIEVGLGGRLDATNLVQPEVTAITPVSFDHETFLGNTLTSIASEKAGILKSGVPLVLGRQLREAEDVILRRAEELHCPVHRVVDQDRTSPDFVTALPGDHQIDNAIAATLVARLLGIRNEAIQSGLARVRWPGRLEYISRHPDFVLDGAHNPAGAAALASYIRQFCQGRPVWMVYGAMRDKAIEEVTATLFPFADRLILTAPDFPRALRPEAILAAHDHPNAIIAPTVPQAIKEARNAPVNACVFFTGSLYLVGEARRLLVAGMDPDVSLLRKAITEV